MKYSKRLIIAASGAGIIGAAGIGATAIAANSSGSGIYPPIVQKIASTFGLDPAKVNDVFKQQRQDNRQDRQDLLKSKLDQAVKEGKLTQDQETKLLAEIQSLHNQFKTDNRMDRMQNRQEFKTILEQWAKDNGITDLDQILPMPAGPHHHGMMPERDNDGDDS